MSLTLEGSLSLWKSNRKRTVFPLCVVGAHEVSEKLSVLRFPRRWLERGIRGEKWLVV